MSLLMADELTHLLNHFVSHCRSITSRRHSPNTHSSLSGDRETRCVYVWFTREGEGKKTNLDFLSALVAFFMWRWNGKFSCLTFLSSRASNNSLLRWEVNQKRFVYSTRSEMDLDTWDPTSSLVFLRKADFALIYRRSTPMIRVEKFDDSSLIKPNLRVFVPVIKSTPDLGWWTMPIMSPQLELTGPWTCLSAH
jgi:hypothetical protein